MTVSWTADSDASSARAMSGKLGTDMSSSMMVPISATTSSAGRNLFSFMAS
ncbi:hypothetical protein LUX12_02340 [Streptomyces somaliensis]|uniref:hypothetical protein n=1 Tax=Streptomyces somaliensis TaxID=78355 RepID=UPI0020CF24A9|nr:hypothetical protein [Streptomyces somaliensis]MCP9943902.1 hypothetical protein [Streptomyces somaliensis]MCP9975692.1 hypothetical protein [Streptomyces somaliensis]